ncbi:hypothetical protein H0E87_023557 [Populus deltoides]|uniref:glutathione transferase n=1 Tax=Populus deltoides TaxID=3696 RepID=A0A8T2XHF7_POPDE|nr:hypothetical protein H0E87_023557 [Populus deltoides]
MEKGVKLLKTWSSPFGIRIVWALKVKGVQFEPIDEDLINKSPLLLLYNPVHKKIPVLVNDGKPVVESLVILEYIEETWKQNPLFPEDPLERAAARFWAKFGDDKVMPSIWEAFIKGREEEECAFAPVFENLKFLEEELKGKQFFGGERIGIVDIAFGWLANLVPVFEEIHAVKMIDEERFPLLYAWMQEFSKAPVIADCWPPHEKLVNKFRAIRDQSLLAAAPNA